MAIALVGLIGVFSTYASAIPYERGLREEAALDRVLPITDRVGLEALRPALADEADLVISGHGALPDRIADARLRLLTRVETESAALGTRMRLFIATFTILAAALGALLLRMVSTAAPSSWLPEALPPGPSDKQ